MIKSYVCVKGEVVTKGEKEIDKVVPYYDNVGARFVVQNEIEFLSASLEKDEKEYNRKIRERETRFESYKKIAPIAGAISVATPFVLSTVSLIGSSAEYVTTYLGNVSPYVGCVSITLPASILLGQTLAGLELIFRPSKKEIAGSAEMVKYEKDTLQLKQDELIELEKDTRKNNLPSNNNFDVIRVDDSGELRRHKENLKLRYAYGAHRDKIFKMYEQGTLVENMVAYGFCEDSIADYVIFIEQKYSMKDEESVVLSKKN